MTFVTLPKPRPQPAPARPVVATLRMIPAPVAPPAPAVDLVLQARSAAGAIDRQLRKESLDMGQRTLTASPSKRETAIAAAHVQRGPNKIVESVLQDGTRVSRVGNTCMQKESNGLVGGRDVFRDGIKTKVMSCPQ